MISYDDLTYNKAILVGNAYCFISEPEHLNESSWSCMIAGHRYGSEVSPTDSTSASSRYGLPVWLFELAELLYLNLAADDAHEFPEALFKAIPVGVSLDYVPMRLRAKLIDGMLHANPYAKYNDALQIAKRAAERGADMATLRDQYEPERWRIAKESPVPGVIHDAVVSTCIADAVRFAVHARAEHTAHPRIDLTPQQRLRTLWDGVRASLFNAIYEVEKANQQDIDEENES